MKKRDPRSFNNFILYHYEWHGDTGVRERLLCANIGSLNGLVRWARERYPDNFTRRSLITGSSNQDNWRRLWAAYLAWRET